MLGREDPLLRLQAGLQQSFGLVETASLAEQLAKLFIIDKVNGAFRPLWRRTPATDRSRIPSCRGEAPREVGVLEFTQGPDLELTNPVLADA
jgi:hypothetical protein